MFLGTEVEHNRLHVYWSGAATLAGTCTHTVSKEIPMYRRYLAAVSGGAGDWFCARTADGRVVGLATVCGTGAACQVDGFAHPYFAAAWPDLLAAAMQRAAERGAGECRAVVCVEDEEKRSLFEGLGFREAGAATDFELAGRAVGAVRMVVA